MQQKSIIVSMELAKDLWTLINEAKHPHHESKVVEQVKGALMQLVQQELMKPQQPGEEPQCVAPISTEETQENPDAA